MAGNEADEAREIIRERLEAMAALSWEELDRYEERTEETVSISGRRFRVKTKTYWDMDPWESDMWMVAVVSPLGSRLRRYRRYRDSSTRAGEELPSAPP